jgi:hypothetical protein
MRGRNCIKNKFKIIGPQFENRTYFFVAGYLAVLMSAVCMECCCYLGVFESCINVLIDRMCCCAGWICATICLI